ncbi:MAG: hypothetical protein V4717_09280 [Bacteroidota bacterium]
MARVLKYESSSVSNQTVGGGYGNAGFSAGYFGVTGASGRVVINFWISFYILVF